MEAFSPPGIPVWLETCSCPDLLRERYMGRELERRVAEFTVSAIVLSIPHYSPYSKCPSLYVLCPASPILAQTDVESCSSHAAL